MVERKVASVKPRPWLSGLLAAALLFQSGCATARRHKDLSKDEPGRVGEKVSTEPAERDSMFPDFRIAQEKELAGAVLMATGVIIIASIGSHLANTAPADWSSPDGFRIGVAGTLLMGGCALFTWGQVQKTQR
jgi:hypothetical protein